MLLLLSAPGIQAQVKPQPDTIVIGGVTVIRDNNDTLVEVAPKKSFFKKLNAKIAPRKIRTEWGVIDIGFSNFIDNTNYNEAGAQAYAPGSNESWFDIRPFKSRNINIWLVAQKINLIHNYVNFQYGLGLELNNYFYKQPIRYDAKAPAIESSPVVSLDPKATAIPAERIYKKNKLAADYVTVPLMLNFNLTPNRLYNFELSAGISVGYLYSARNKTITSDEGKQKARDDFDLSPWKLSYIADVKLGVITFYGSYAFKSMYKRGLNITPYNFGIRIRPADIIAKIDSQ